MTRPVAALCLVLLGFYLLPADEGMHPINALERLDLRAKGLDITARDIFNPEGIGLTDAIVDLGGGTGSFVSDQGLIITNHHIAFAGVQAASSPEHDYVTDGFTASDRSQEVPARGYVARITESVTDISPRVLAAAKPSMDYATRTRAIERRIKEIVLEAEKRHPGKRADVSEMFPGKTYLLFLSTQLRDVRLVYVPPRGIGDFGGETDNWAWPRHGGDFSFLRAYTGPDGKPADHHPGNVPYRPRTYLKVAAKGVAENDAIFIPGYPGRTYRHFTSHFLDFEQRLRMPVLADLMGWQIAEMERMSAQDPEVAIRLSARIKGLANGFKNYRSKLVGMKRLALVAAKSEEERKLAAFIAADPQRQQKYGRLFADSEAIYREQEAPFERELVLDQLPRAATLLSVALTVVEAGIERAKGESERETPFMSRNLAQTRERLRLALKNFHKPADILFLREMLLRGSRLEAGHRIPVIDQLVAGLAPEAAIDAFLAKAYQETGLADPAVALALFDAPPAEVVRSPDPLLSFARKLYPTLLALREVRKTRKGRLDELYSRWIEVKGEQLKTGFIPDANSTLRVTFGRIKGYSPRDGVFFHPHTTLRGLVEKATGKFPFAAPARLLELAARGDFAPYALPGGELPVAMLYDADTTGGNSGSPVLNRRGELVGVNFDRTGEATINDYCWSADYSRSIAVDIRYVLWVVGRFAGNGALLKELGG